MINIFMLIINFVFVLFIISLLFLLDMESNKLLSDKEYFWMIIITLILFMCNVMLIATYLSMYGFRW